jgi:hypothetical protein
MKSITAAIREARENVKLIPFGKQWQVNTYFESHRAWWQGQPTDYFQARSTATDTIVAYALVSLGADHFDASCEACSETRGNVCERVKSAASRLGLL